MLDQVLSLPDAMRSVLTAKKKSRVLSQLSWRMKQEDCKFSTQPRQLSRTVESLPRVLKAQDSLAPPGLYGLIFSRGLTPFHVLLIK